MQLDKNTLKKIAGLIGGAILLHWGLQNLALLTTGVNVIWKLLFPFILGLLLAYLLNIPMRGIEKKLFKNKKTSFARFASFFITFISLIVVLGLVLFLVLPELASTIAILGKSLPGYFTQIETMLEPYTEYIPQLEELIQQADLDWGEISKKILASLGYGAGNIVNTAWGATVSLVSGTTNFFIALIFAVYLLFDKERFSAQLDGVCKAYLPEKKYAKLRGIAELTDTTFSKFVAGQCTEAVAISLVFLIVLSVFRFDYALLISVLIGFMSLIPVFGAFIGCAVGAFLIFVSQGWFYALLFVIVFLVVQQLDGNFMYPKIVGNSVGLPPVWVMVAVIIGGGMFGVAGMLFFIPLSSVIYTLLVQNTVRRLQQKGIEVPTLALPQKEKSTKKKKK